MLIGTLGDTSKPNTTKLSYGEYSRIAMLLGNYYSEPYMQTEFLRQSADRTTIHCPSMVPARFIAESLGCKVGWNEKTKLVLITDGAPADSASSDAQSTSKDGYVTIKGSRWNASYNGEDGNFSYDGKNDTVWSVAGYEGHWIEYDFGEVTPVSAASIL